MVFLYNVITIMLGSQNAEQIHLIIHQLYHY